MNTYESTPLVEFDPVQEASEESFPASDPPAWTLVSGVGAPVAVPAAKPAARVEPTLARDNKRVLLAVDGSAASERTTAYVADIIGGRPGFHVGLLHLEVPPRMLEWGGSEDPKVEARVSAQREEACREIEAEQIVEAEKLMRPLRAILAEKGVDVMGLFVRFEEPLDRATITQAILDAARKHGCGTIVVGRHSFTGLQRLFQHHIGEELVRDGEGVAVWVVE